MADRKPSEDLFAGLWSISVVYVRHTPYTKNMNTATASKCFGFTTLRVDFVRASGACCALRTRSEHWEMYKCEDGLEIFAGYAVGAARAELERVYRAAEPQLFNVHTSGKSNSRTIETTLGTIEIETVRSRAEAA